MTYPPDLSYGAESRVVLIGTSECPKDEANLPPLPQVQANVRHLQQLFLDPDVIGLPASSVVTILDEPEASAITTQIDTAANEANDTLIIYYAGHGLYGDQFAPLYLTSKNTRSQSKTSAININEVRRVMQASPARKRILILDCCYSGRAFSGGMNAVSDELKSAVDLKGTYGIAAVPGDHKAWAPPGATLTKFTEALVTVLKTGVKTDSETLTLGEVFDAVKTEIARDADMPLPEASNWQDGSKFKLVRNRYLRSNPTELLHRNVEAIQQKLVDANLRIETLEGKVTAIPALEAKVLEMEDKLAQSASRHTLREDSSSETFAPWTRLDIHKEDWDRLPAEPYKQAILNFFDARRNTRIVISGMFISLISTVILCLLPAPIAVERILGVGATMLAFGYLFLTFAALLARLPGSNWVNYEVTIKEEIIQRNALAMQALRTHYRFAFGHIFDSQGLRRVATLGCFGSVLILFVYSISGSYHIFFQKP